MAAFIPFSALSQDVETATLPFHGAAPWVDSYGQKSKGGRKRGLRLHKAPLFKQSWPDAKCSMCAPQS